MGEFRMPSLGADMETGTIVEWRVRPGDRVHRGDIVAVVDTEKSTIDVEVFEDGVVEELVVPPGVEVPVGTVLARLAGVPGEPVVTPRVLVPAGTVVEPRAAVEVPAPPVIDRGSLGEIASHVRASPRARRAAAERGIDLHSVAGSGPGGAVLTEDLHTTPPAVRVAAPEPGSAGRRGTTGALMARSKREIPHYYLATTIDLGPATAWLAAANEERPVTERLLPAALLLKATAAAAREVPVVNGTWSDGFVAADAVHLGVAISVRGGGLVAPVIGDADTLDVRSLMLELRGVVQRVRDGTLRSSDVRAPTLSVTNLGDQGVEEVFGIITPPQVAVVGFGRIVERPWAVDGAVCVRPVVRATLAADHRASDGRDGARFLAAIDRWLQNPEDR